jgi:hypothetical protein
VLKRKKESMKEIADNKNPEQTAMFVLNTKTTLFYPFKNAIEFFAFYFKPILFYVSPPLCNTEFFVGLA